jgi:hypothetical protein
MAEPQRQRGGDDTTAWPGQHDGMIVETRPRRGGDGMAETTAWRMQQCNIVAEKTRQRGGYGGVLLFRVLQDDAAIERVGPTMFPI